MGINVFERLWKYYQDVANVLKWEADAASVFPNSSDIWSSREKIYLEFLRQHLPSRCNIFFWWFIFDEEWNESKQLDVIITTDTTPKFDFHNDNGSGKSFSPIEWTLWVVSIKSTLDKQQLFESLNNIASIPNTASLDWRLNITSQIWSYENWPYKIIYASEWIEWATVLNHIKKFYQENSEIPIFRRPDMIHVAWKYVIFRGKAGFKLYSPSLWTVEESNPNDFHLFTNNSDIQAICNVISEIQELSNVSSDILYSYKWISNKVNWIKL